MAIEGAISQKIQQMRHRARLTLDDASKMTKISRSSLHRMEHGQQQITLDMLDAVATAYGSSIESIVKAARKAS